LLIRFFVQLAQQVMPHIGEARGAKGAFDLEKVLGMVRQTAAATVGKGKLSGPQSWESVSGYVGEVVKEISSLLPAAMEVASVMKSE
jgi:dynactin 1